MSANPAVWLLLTRDATGKRTGALPVTKASGVLRWLGVSSGVVEVAYSADAYTRLVEGTGLELLRNGARLASGWLTDVTDTYPGGLKASFVGEQQVLADAVVAPNPAAAGTAQTATGQWSRTGVASTVMAALLAEQLGPTAHTDWRVPGLTVAADPHVGGTVTAAIRYGNPNLLAELTTLGVNSGVDLGVSVDPDGAGGLTATVRAPVDVSATARFSVALGNLLAYDYVRTAPTVTRVLVENTTAGTRATAAATDPLTTAWKRAAWTYKQAATGDNAKALPAQAADELVTGQARESLTCKLRDSPALAFGRGWSLGSRVTVAVGRPGEPTVDVVDVVREVAYEFGRAGELITPAIGSTAATALPTLPSRQALARIAGRLAALERRN